jgi:outer membrane protein OmpA-like peptidoglycan-associated protein
METKADASAAVAPELPKPPVALKKDEPAKAAAVGIPALPPLPKLSAEKNILAIPPKPPLPPLTAITGDKAPQSTADILQPKDAIAAAPLAPAVPAAASSATTAAPQPAGLPALPPLPKLPASAKSKNDAPSAPKPDNDTVAGAQDKIATTVNYANGRVDPSDDAKVKLNEIAETLKKSQRSVRVVAIAGGTAEEASVSRRTALARGNALRAFLIEKGVNKLNVIVQVAKPEANDAANTERADIFLK